MSPAPTRTGSPLGAGVTAGGLDSAAVGSLVGEPDGDAVAAWVAVAEGAPAAPSLGTAPGPVPVGSMSRVAPSRSTSTATKTIAPRATSRTLTPTGASGTGSGSGIGTEAVGSSAMMGVSLDDDRLNDAAATSRRPHAAARLSMARRAHDAAPKQGDIRRMLFGEWVGSEVASRSLYDPEKARRS